MLHLNLNGQVPVCFEHHVVLWKDRSCWVSGSESGSFSGCSAVRTVLTAPRVFRCPVGLRRRAPSAVR